MKRKVRSKQGITAFGVIAIAIILLMVGGLTLGAYIGVRSYFAGIQFSNSVGSYYNLASQSSNATEKLYYWNKFAHAIESYGLTTGSAVSPGLPCNCYQNQQFNLTNQWQANVLAINSSLTALVRSCPVTNNSTAAYACQTSFSYVNELNRIDFQDICWFPINYYSQAWRLKQGIPAAGWGDPGNPYECGTTTTA
ncbi:MAG: hypothetical protein ACYC9R_13125 [Nitrosotalea sp.]